jgi:hypothetical protein
MSFCIKTGHQFAETHVVVAHCDSKQEKHIHDSSYQKDDCSICQFTVSIAELLDFQAFSFTKKSIPAPKKHANTVNVLVSNAWIFASLRAPPCCV